ncbi:MAG TPA: iron chelate uptake ABC transporter family permease subunit [Planctomycetota bacterium]|nr:iron chelate uptake ABC transporter family permease subunit [Planctomycetota bacterium]
MKRIGSAPALIAGVAAIAAVLAISVAWGASGWFASETILWRLRLPRALLAAAVGAALATAGAIFQGLFRNPLADPFVVGVSGGAALGAVTAIILGLTAGIPVFAFVGGLGAVMLVYRLARVRGRVPIATLLLAGFAVGSLASATLSILLMTHTRNFGDIMLWLMGSFVQTDAWGRLAVMAPAALAALAVAFACSRDLNLFLLGEESARHLGVDVERAKAILLATGAVATAAAVSSAGIIGFVGLIVPNLARALVGPDHRRMLPVCAVLGAALVATADFAARSILRGAELPVGAITAVAGAPFFLIVLKRKAAAA